MLRSLMLSAVATACLYGSALAQEKPIDPARVIERLKEDFESARDRLEKKNAGEATRKVQKNIIDGLNQLLNQPNDDPPSSHPPSNVNQPNPPNETKATPRPEAAKQAAEPAKTGSEKEGLPVAKNTVAGVMDRDGRWPGLPARRQVEMDAFQREQFMERYQELLRAYYRNIAEANQK